MKQVTIGLGQQIRAKRKQQNLTMAQVAAKAKISEGTLCQFENGKRDITTYTLNAILGALHCCAHIDDLGG